jgi:hypothetical protein
MREYVEPVLRRKNWSPINPTYAKKHVESILGTRKNMTEKVFNLNNTIPHSVRLVNPIAKHVISIKHTLKHITKIKHASKHATLTVIASH